MVSIVKVRKILNKPFSAEVTLGQNCAIAKASLSVKREVKATEQMMENVHP